MNAHAPLVTFRILFSLLFLGLHLVSNAQNVELRSQADVDAFDPLTTEINGTLLLGDQGSNTSNIVDISNLSNIERVYGDLIISRNVNLLDIDELNNITRIGGYLSVTTNENLKNIDGLSNLFRMGLEKDLIIYENSSLENIDGLSNLKADVGILRIFNNSTLANLNGLKSIEKIQSVEIEYNDGLVSLSGFEGLSIISGNTRIRSNIYLETITGFNNVKELGIFQIYENPSLINVEMYTTRETLKGALSIFRNDALEGINGFDSLRYVSGSLSISNNANLISIDGLKNIISVSRDLQISGSRVLTNVDALSNLSSVGNVMRIISNEKLSNCCAIRDLVEDSEIAIGDTLFIDNNAYGCDTIPEILEISCEMRLNCAMSPPCVGGQNGAIHLFVDNYTSVPFSYSWHKQEDNTMGSGSSESDNFNIDMLSGGTYDITVTTPTPDTIIKSNVVLLETEGSLFEVIEINSLNSSNGLSNGSLSLTVDGGVAPYSYSWTGPEEGSQLGINTADYTIGGLRYGEYTIVIEDDEGSMVTIEVTLLDDEVQVIDCEEPLDIVILNDVSTSVDALEYRQSQKFFVDFLKFLNIGTGDNDSRAAIIEWAYSQDIKIPITGDISELESYTNLTRSFEGATAAHDAMQYAQLYLDEKARPNATKVLILSTDATSGQISSSLSQLANQLKDNGYHIVTIAIDNAYNSPAVRERLRDIASFDLLAPGATSYNDLDSQVAEDIAGIYLCPIDPGSSATAYFNRDGEIEITEINVVGDCPFPDFIEVTIDISALRELSVPAGTPVTFYSNDPFLYSAIPIFTWYVPCGILANTTETFTITVPVDGPTNLFAILNDDGLLNPPISFPITSIEELAYSNNQDSAQICTNGIAAIQAFKFIDLPVPGCDTLVNYTINVCNVSEINAFGVVVEDRPPPGFELTNSVFIDNGCATAVDFLFYNLPAGCCFSLYLTYDASEAESGFYGDQDVILSGPDNNIYYNFDGSTTTAEDVTIDGTIDCNSPIIEFSKSVNLEESCDDGFVEFTFTINNEMNIPLKGLTFKDLLPDPCTWIFMPYGAEGLSIGNTELNGNEAIFTIDEVQPNTIATFHIDASLNSWDADGVLNNTASLSNVPDVINGGVTTLFSNTTQTEITSSPKLIIPDTIIVDRSSEVVNLSPLISTDANVFWTTDGDGYFSNPTMENTSYFIGEQDLIIGEVGLFVSAMSDCNETGASAVIKIVDCSLEVEIVEIGDCNDMGTPLDESDDVYEVTFVVSSDNITEGDQFFMSVNDDRDTLSYLTEHTIVLMANGIVDFLSFENQDSCFVFVELYQEACADACVTIAEVEDLTIYDCNDNGTPQDSTDDFYGVEFTIQSDNATSDHTFVTSYKNEIYGPYDYGDLVSMTLDADLFLDSIWVIDSNIDTCSFLLFANQESCSSEIPCTNGLQWPKVFFPNGMDELNRNFGPYNPCDLIVSNYSLKIFNRWGNEVFATNDYSIEWDGRHNESESATAVYVYVAEYSLNGVRQPVKKGDVTLLRD